MRGGFARHVEPLCTRARDQLDAAGRADVDHVQRAVRLPCQKDGPLDGLQFRDDRTRREVIRRAETPFGDRQPRQPRRDALVLGVDGDDLLQIARPAHPFEQRAVVRKREIVYPAVAHKGFEAHHAAGRQIRQVREVPRAKCAPETEVHHGTGLRGLPLGEEALLVQHGWPGVERHVEVARHPARREGARAAGEAFPIRPARLVEMHVRINPAREDVKTGGVEVGERGTEHGVAQRGDLAVLDADVQSGDSLGPDDAAAADDQVVVAHRKAEVGTRKLRPANGR